MSNHVAHVRIFSPIINILYLNDMQTPYHHILLAHNFDVTAIIATSHQAVLLIYLEHKSATYSHV